VGGGRSWGQVRAGDFFFWFFVFFFSHGGRRTKNTDCFVFFFFEKEETRPFGPRVAKKRGPALLEGAGPFTGPVAQKTSGWTGEQHLYGFT